jgi:hypothetical protein
MYQNVLKLYNIRIEMKGLSKNHTYNHIFKVWSSYVISMLNNLDTILYSFRLKSKLCKILTTVLSSALNSQFRDNAVFLLY